MKASVKLRDGKEPLVRAKLPLNILGLPLSSGLTLGSSDELGIHLSTHCEAGPCCRLTFWPNRPSAPVSLLVKAGLGPWASSSDTGLAMSAEIRMSTCSATRAQPSLMFMIKPRLGDFGLLKKAAAPLISPAPAPKRWQLLKSKLEEPAAAIVSVAERANVFSCPSPEEVCSIKVQDDNAKKLSSECLKGWSLVARSSLPLGSRMSASLRWRVGIAHDCVDKLASDPQSFKMPLLKLDKVSLVETIFKESMMQQKQQQQQVMPVEDTLGVEESKELNRVASMCSSMRRQLQLVQAENQVLKQTMEDVRSNFHKTDTWKLSVPTVSAMEQQQQQQPLEADTENSVAEELRKAIMNAKTGC